MNIDPVTILQDTSVSIDLYVLPSTADDGRNGSRCATYTFSESYDEVWVIGCDSMENMYTGKYLFQYAIGSDALVKFDGRGTSQNLVIFTNISIGDTFLYYTYRDNSGLYYLNGMKYIGINYN